MNNTLGQWNDRGLADLSKGASLWDRVYTVAPLVIVGTKGDNTYNLAPKHLAMPVSWDRFYGFVCTPAHKTYQNILEQEEFTVSFILPKQVTLGSLAASPRCDEEDEKPIIHDIPTFRAKEVDAPFVEDAYLFLECKLHSIVDDLGNNSLIIGKVIHAYARTEYLRDSEIDGADLVYKNPLLVYLPPDRFASISASLSFPFPKGFKK